MSFFETHLGFVDMWECDENEHMNVRFYWSKFEAADRQFRVLAGLDGLLPRRRTRHVRYHAEMHGGASVVVRSARVEAPTGQVAIVHEMRLPGREAIAATALDRYDVALADGIGPAAIAMPDHARPRGIDAAPAPFPGSDREMLEAGGAVTARGRVTVAEADVDGVIEDHVHISRASDAAPHAWKLLGMTPEWMEANGVGRVAVEMKLSYGEPLRAGDLVHLATRVVGLGRSTMTVRHGYFESRSGRLAAVCDVVALPMDLALRRAVPIPELARERAAALGVSVGA